MPSEAEWEYACRGARSNDTYCGGNSVDSVGWYKGNSGRETHLVGQRSANDYGLHDMSGNVWEWVQDCWNEDYHGVPANGHAWLSYNCEKHVLRGGSWYDEPRFLQSTNRSKVSAFTRAKFTDRQFGHTFGCAHDTGW